MRSFRRAWNYTVLPAQTQPSAGCGDILDEAGENDTLVVETDSFDGLEGYNKMDTFGHPLTDQMKILERIRRVAPDTLRIDFTFDAPGAYTDLGRNEALQAEAGLGDYPRLRLRRPPARTIPARHEERQGSREAIEDTLS